MWGPFDTSFNGRDATAFIDLERVGAVAPEAARASTGR